MVYLKNNSWCGFVSQLTKSYSISLQSILSCLLIFGLLMINCKNKSQQTNFQQSVPIIFDTDIGNDIDDMLALAMLHRYVDLSKVNLLAVTISKDNPWAAPFVDLTNHFYGHPNIPIGVVRNGVTPASGNFIEAVASKKVGDDYLYPRSLVSGEDAPEAVSLQRKILAAQPDQSVVFVVVGFSTNIARLLQSQPDKYSDLSGMELVEKKCRLLSNMAGMFGESPLPEYNVKEDVESARYVFDHWPTPVVTSGFEIGKAILYPAASIENDFTEFENHPLVDAYKLYMKMPYDRPTWDLTSVLYAVEPAAGYFGLSPFGKITVDEDVVTRFSENVGGNRRYLTVSTKQVNKTLARLIELVVPK